MWPANYELDNAAYASVYSHQFYSSSNKNPPTHQLNNPLKGSPSINQFNGDELERANELARGNELGRNNELGRSHELSRGNGLGRGHDRSSDLNRNADQNRNVDPNKADENRNAEPTRNAADLSSRYSAGSYQLPCSPILHSPNKLHIRMNGNSFWPNYTSYSNYNQIATAIAAVQTAVANSGHEPANSVQGYSSTNLIHNSGSGVDSFRTRPDSSLEPTSSTNFYNSATCLSLDLPPSTPGKLRGFFHFASSFFHSFLVHFSSSSSLFSGSSF